jgi:hypothetical protein
MVGAASYDSYISVSHQWYTCARAVARPCIEWTGPYVYVDPSKPLKELTRRQQERESTKPKLMYSQSSSSTAILAVIQPLILMKRKYPNVINAHSLMGWLPDEVHIDELLSCSFASSLLSSLRSIQFHVHDGSSSVDAEKLTDLGRRIASMNNTSFRDFSLVMSEYVSRISDSAAICQAAWALVDSWKQQW